MPRIPEVRRIAGYAAATIAVLAAGLALYHALPGPLFILADNTVIPACGRPKTVGELLAGNQVRMGPLDEVIPPAQAAPPRRGTVRVVRVREETIESTEQGRFHIRRRDRRGDNLRPVELQRGFVTAVSRLTHIVWRDGREASRKTVRERTLRSARYRLALINAQGEPEQIYDLSSAKKIPMIATAYYPGDPLAWRTGTITFTGKAMRRGIVAVDPRIIPLHTRVYVSGYGYGYAADTGSAIKGRRIDLGVRNREEEKAWMHRPVTVYILEERVSNW